MPYIFVIGTDRLDILVELGIAIGDENAKQEPMELREEVDRRHVGVLNNSQKNAAQNTSKVSSG